MSRQERAGRPVQLCVFAAGLALGLSGCGGNLMAPDPLVENPEADAFLTRIGKECADYSIGTNPLNYLIQEGDDDYFIDITTKLYFGRISRKQYASDINAFYPTDANKPALECIFSKLLG